MSDHLNPNLTARQIFARVLFSLAVAAATIGCTYETIRWLSRSFR
jgi:hypothetical protein